MLASLAGIILGAFGRYSPDLDLIANLRGHLLGLFAFSVLALWLDHRPVLVAALGVFLTFAAHALLAQQNEGPLFGTARAASPADAHSWTILSLNTWHQHPDSAGLADYLTQSNADVLVLTQFGPNKIADLHALATVYPYRQDCATDWNCAIAIVSRHPFSASGSTPEGAGPARAWITFGNGRQAVTVMGVHVTQPLRSPVLNARQLTSLAVNAHEQNGRILITGDFGVTPWTYAFARFSETSGLNHMGRFLPTFPSGKSGLPQLAVNHMFASPGITFEDVWIGPDVGSDHRPLLAEVRFPDAILAARP